MKKEPKYKFRYAGGLGDILTCILHSKYIGILVKFITKKEEQCSACSQRSYILNLFFPIPIWKFYFSSIEERNEKYTQELKDMGYIFDHLEKQKQMNEQKCNCQEQSNQQNILNGHKIDFIEYEGYELNSKEESNDDEYKTVKFIYKKVS
jgi:hypothetical protein